tara:strand:- start:4930 stop:5301 length:372 start_codon:yes stop_codon:yes gene_type:complete
MSDKKKPDLPEHNIEIQKVNSEKAFTDELKKVLAELANEMIMVAELHTEGKPCPVSIGMLGKKRIKENEKIVSMTLENWNNSEFEEDETIKIQKQLLNGVMWYDYLVTIQFEMLKYLDAKNKE